MATNNRQLHKLYYKNCAIWTTLMLKDGSVFMLSKFFEVFLGFLTPATFAYSCVLSFISP